MEQISCESGCIEDEGCAANHFMCRLVYVFDPNDMGDYQIPIGKQTVGRGGMIWYTPCSGIWQTVWLESVPAVYITKLDLVADMNGKGTPLLVGGASD